MIFTIGHTESYQRYFKEQDTPMKLGRVNSEDFPNYPGGSVWKTYEEAKNNCPPLYSVYGVLADWEEDTVLNENGSWNDLLVTSALVDLKIDKLEEK